VKDDRIYLNHMLECIGRIEEYTKGNREAFLASTLIQDGILRNLQTLGQSSVKISEPLKKLHPEIDWSGIVGFRNVLVHDYLGINLNRVWEIVENDLPGLKQKIQTILAKSD
jgi:uncharacterized protein with HEPN domain